MRRHRTWALALTLALTLPVARAEDGEVARAIGGLASPDYRARGDALERLRRAGLSAEAELRVAAGSRDAATREAAGRLLDDLEWGLVPGLPRATRSAIGAARQSAAVGEARVPLVAPLIDAAADHPEAIGRALRRLRLGLDADAAATVAGTAETYYRGVTWPRLHAARRVAAAEAALGLVLDARPTDALAADFAELTRQRGTLPAALARWEARERAATPAEASGVALVLTYLYRAADDWPKARAAATEANRGRDLRRQPDLVDAVLWQAGDYAALDDLPVAREGYYAGGLRVAYARLAGDAARAAREADALVASAEAVAPGVYVSEHEVRELLLSGRVDAALALVRRSRYQLPVLFDLLAARQQYKEALDLPKLIRDLPAGRARDDRARELFDLEVRRARLLHQLGERAAAERLFAETLFDWPDSVPSLQDRAEEVIKAEVRVNRRDLAAAHLVRAEREVFRDINQSVAPNLLAEYAGPQRAALAARLWKRDDESTIYSSERVTQVVRALDGSATLAELEAWFPGLAEPADAAGWDTRARLALLARDGRAAGEALRRAAYAGAGAEAWARWGDWHLRAGRAAEAAARLAQGRERHPNSALLAHLEAHALARAGDRAAAARAADSALLLSLGDDLARAALADDLRKREALSAARAEAGHLIAHGWYRHYTVGNALNGVARDAIAAGDYARAARLFERAMVGLMRSGAYYIDAGAYLRMPIEVRLLDARAALEAGRADEAMATVRECLKLWPGNSALAQWLVPHLDRLGRQGDAAEVLAAVVKAHEDALRDFPESGFLRNSVAWTCALCGRDLDRALAHANRAVAAEPGNAGYRDTLAEVHFRRGETARALELMRECLAQEPNRRYYRQQLERFGRGDTKAEVPDENDDED